MEVPFQYGRLAEAESFIDRIDDRRELKNFHLFTSLKFYAKIQNYTHTYNTTAYNLFFFKRNHIY